jgi:hypothetical protein
MPFLAAAEDLTGPYDVTSTREIPLDNGNTLYLKRTDPFGFFVFSLAKGNIPKWMQGNYTSLSEAQKAVQQYLRDREFEKSKDLDLVSPKADSTKKKA